MSVYCTFDPESCDVFMANTGSTIKCFSCKLQQTRKGVDENGDDTEIPIPPIIQVAFDSRAEALAHLDQHMARGHRVPAKVMDRIRKEIQVYGYAVA